MAAALLLLLLLSLRPCAAEPEAEALLLLKGNFTGDAAAVELRSWDPAASAPCSKNTANWAGVVCLNGVVTALHLGNMGLAGRVDVDALLGLPGLRSISIVNNSFDGDLPALNRIGALKSVFLTGNHFSGDVPDDFFAQMQSLKKVWLDRNAFSGNVPSSLAALPHLIELHLEHNQFSGSVVDLQQSTLASFNISDNPRLEGPIPTALSRFEPSSFSGNAGLCGRPLEKTCTAKSEGPKLDSSKSKVIGMSIVLVLCLLAVVFVASKKSGKQEFDTLGRDQEDMVEVCVSSHNNRKGSGHSSRRSMGAGEAVAAGHQRKESAGGKKGGAAGVGDLVVVNEEKGVFGLPDLMKAAAEVLGSNGTMGSAYKAVMANGVSVVVKRMREMNRVGQDGFEAEMRRLGHLRHPNILTPLAFHYRKEEKLLVYEYVPGGSLLFLLHGNRGLCHTELDWPTRLKIVRGIADGVAYLHDQLPNSDLPHGNLKSSNVLLSPELSPLLTDFGFSPLVIPTHASHSMFAYKSPESLQYRHVSPKSDVYCLGVLLLEILTGKYPSQYNNGGKGGTDLVNWVTTSLADDGLADLFDPEILPKTSAARASMETLLRLGADCAEPDPDRRPNMKEVLKRVDEVAALAAAPEDPAALLRDGPGGASSRRPSHAENVRALSSRRRESFNGSSGGGSSSWSNIDSSGFAMS